MPYILYADNIDKKYDEAVFKLFVNKEYIGDVTILFNNKNSVYFALAEYLSLLGYPFDLKTEDSYSRFCYPSKKGCYEIKGDSLFSDSTSSALQTKLIWENEQPFIDYAFIKQTTPFPIQIFINSLSIHLYCTPKDNVPLINLGILKSKRENAMSKLYNNEVANSTPLKYGSISSLGYSFSIRNMRYLNDYSWSLNGLAVMNGELFKGNYDIEMTYSNDKNGIGNTYLGTWSKSNINKKYLKQIILFRSNANTIISSPFFTNGVLFTNMQQTGIEYRNYELIGKTTPNTQIELYNNKQFVGLVTSDSIGNYRADIPVGGGNNNISAIIYDNYGSTISQDQVFFLPPNLEPKNNLSYKLYSGIMDSGDWYYQLLFNYGITHRITASIASEAIANNYNFKQINIFTVRSSLTKVTPMEIHLIPKVRWGINGGIYTGSRFNLNYNYMAYNSNQNYIMNNPIKNYGLNISSLLPFKFVESYSLLSLQSAQYTDFGNFNANFSLNSRYRRYLVGFNVSGYSQNNYSINNLMYGLRIGYHFNPQLYSESFVELNSVRNEFRLNTRTTYRRVNKIDFFAETLWIPNISNYKILLGLVWNLRKTDFRSSASIGDQFSSVDLNLTGSMLAQKQNTFILSNTFQTGANLQIIPFVDVNGNKKYDKGEPIVNSIQIIAKGGEVHHNKNSISIVRIPPNRPFKIIIPRQPLKDISWQISPKTINMILSQYQSYTEYIPINVYSEISGYAFLNQKGNKRTARVKIIAKNIHTNEVISAYTDQSGYYHINNLVAGNYIIEIPISQFEKKNSKFKPTQIETREIHIPAEIEGQHFDGIDFNIIAQE